MKYFSDYTFSKCIDLFSFLKEVKDMKYLK